MNQDSSQPPQPPPNYYYPPPPKPGMSTGAKIALGIIIGFCVLTGGCFACASWIWNNAKQDPELTKLLANSNSVSKPTSPPVKTTLSNADKLAQARDIMGHYTAELDLVRAKDFLSEIPEAAPEYAEAKRLLGQLEPRIRKAAIAEAPAIRELLAEDYRQTVAKANSHLNFIGKKITKVKGGYAIWALHEFFSRYTLSTGGDAQVVQTWLVSNYADLKKVQIVQVGFWGSGGFSGQCWLKLP